MEYVKIITICLVVNLTEGIVVINQVGTVAKESANGVHAKNTDFVSAHLVIGLRAYIFKPPAVGWWIVVTIGEIFGWWIDHRMVIRDGG